jgi:hypothetical protein
LVGWDKILNVVVMSCALTQPASLSGTGVWGAVLRPREILVPDLVPTRLAGLKIWRENHLSRMSPFFCKINSMFLSFTQKTVELI